MQKDVIIYRLDDAGTAFQIEPMNMQRSWMHKTTDKFAYKCLPLGIANQYGWQVLSPVDFSVSWYGGERQEDIVVESDDPDFDKYRHSFNSHFANRVFTINHDFIVTTPENYSLYIRGVPNKEYGILRPLDAIVETDWLPFTFTYNFRFMEIGTVHFKKGEPLFCFFPVERNTVENFKIKEKNIKENPELLDKFEDHSYNRSVANRDGKFQRFYINGTDSYGNKYSIKNHIKRLMFGIINK
jgi:hypothetical protein